MTTDNNREGNKHNEDFPHHPEVSNAFGEPGSNVPWTFPVDSEEDQPNHREIPRGSGLAFHRQADDEEREREIDSRLRIELRETDHVFGVDLD